MLIVFFCVCVWYDKELLWQSSNSTVDRRLVYSKFCCSVFANIVYMSFCVRFQDRLYGVYLRGIASYRIWGSSSFTKLFQIVFQREWYIVLPPADERVIGFFVSFQAHCLIFQVLSFFDLKLYLILV